MVRHGFHSANEFASTSRLCWKHLLVDLDENFPNYDPLWLRRQHRGQGTLSLKALDRLLALSAAWYCQKFVSGWVKSPNTIDILYGGGCGPTTEGRRGMEVALKCWFLLREHLHVQYGTVLEPDTKA